MNDMACVDYAPETVQWAGEKKVPLFSEKTYTVACSMEYVTTTS